MTTTYRPNVRRVTSPQTIARVKWDVLAALIGALMVSLAIWAAFFHLVTR